MQAMRRTTIPAPVDAALRRAARTLYLDRAIEPWLTLLDATASLTEIRARVLDVIEETPDTKSFVLAPNRLWKGHRAGQWVSVEVELDGARVSRCYSIASAPGSGALTITVRRIEGGRVSEHLHGAVRPGSVLTLGPAGGGFVLPGSDPGPLLFIAGGTGITPIVSILRDLDARHALDGVVLVQLARGPEHVLYRETLDALVHRGLRLHRWLDGSDGQPALDEARLEAAVPDLAERTTYLCGPTGLMARIDAMWARLGIAHRLVRERFAPEVTVTEPTGATVQVHLGGGRRAIEASTSRTLLASLEDAGERPASGCRMGLCGACACTKKRGVVLSTLTGERSDREDEQVRLCVSVPLGDVELGL